MKPSIKDLSEHGIFKCPTLQHVIELQMEIAEIKSFLNSKEKYPPLLDNSDLIRQYRISRTTAAQWRSHGLEYTKVGNKLYYRQEAINEFLSQHRRKSF